MSALLSPPNAFVDWNFPHSLVWIRLEKILAALRTVAHAGETVQARLSELPGAYEKLLKAEEGKLRAAAQVVPDGGADDGYGVCRGELGWHSSVRLG